MDEWIVSVSGIRGIVGQCFPPHRITRIGAALGTLLRQKCDRPPRVAIARDTRPSGEMARHALVAGLLGTGCDVVDLGICPTPTLLLSSKKLEMDGSVMITASHNPGEWNGLEIAAAKGSFLDASDREAILQIESSGRFAYQSWESQGTLERWDGGIDLHIRTILESSLIQPDRIRARQLKVVVDAVNGAGSVITPRLLRELGCEVVPLYCEPNGRFERSPEPTSKNLDKLCQVVRQERADVGLAHDADADRLTLVTEQGEALSEEYTLPLIADYVLRQRVGPVVTTVSTSLMVEDIAARYDAPVIRTKVGVNHVADAIVAHSAVIGGEGTGGIIFPEIHLTSDGITAAACVAQVLAETANPLSALISQIPRYFIFKISVPVPAEVDRDAIVARALSAFTDERLDTTDGVKILREHAWVSLRKSGTEPVIRVFGEARSPQQAEAFCREIAGHVQRWIAEMRSRLLQEG